MTMQAIVAMASKADVYLFRLINQSFFGQWLADITHLFARDYVILWFLLSLVLFYIWLRGWRQAILTALLGGLGIVFANLIQNNLFKPFFNRQRPFSALDDVHLSASLRDLSMVSLSFPSTHAVSSAALATVVMALDPSLKIPAIIFPLVIGFFTVYSGGHYPFDVIAGYLVGIAIGQALVSSYRLIKKRKHYSRDSYSAK